MTRDQFIEISKWQDETFGQATALSKMYHLAEEVIVEALAMLGILKNKS